MSGWVPMRLALRLRFDYGRIVPWVRHYDGQLAAVAGPDAAWLSSRCRCTARTCAALLLIPQVGFLPWRDARVVGTVDAVRRELSSDGFLLRYRHQADGNVDGLSGAEGAFVTCTFWLADALFGIGREHEAHRLFEHLLSLRNDLGLLSGEYDPGTGRQLGNTPQAFSHVGLVNAARHLSQNRSARNTSPGMTTHEGQH